MEELCFYPVSTASAPRSFFPVLLKSERLSGRSDNIPNVPKISRFGERAAPRCVGATGKNGYSANLANGIQKSRSGKTGAAPPPPPPRPEKSSIFIGIPVLPSGPPGDSNQTLVMFNLGAYLSQSPSLYFHSLFSAPIKRREFCRRGRRRGEGREHRRR